MTQELTKRMEDSGFVSYDTGMPSAFGFRLFDGYWVPYLSNMFFYGLKDKTEENAKARLWLALNERESTRP